MQIKKSGMYRMSATEYHSDPLESPSLSSSVAWEIEPANKKAGAPAFAKMIHPKLGGSGKQTTDTMRFGSICHSMLLGSGSDFKIAPTFKTQKGEASIGFKSSEGQKWKTECEASGALPILQSESSEAEKCVATWKEQIDAFGLSRVFGGRNESVVIWLEKASIDVNLTYDVWCRAMIDIWLEEFLEIWDIKTTTSVHPKKIQSKIVDDGLALRSEFYKRGVETVLPENAGRIKSGFLFLQTVAPYLVLPVMQLNGQFRMIGRQQAQRSINTFGRCLSENRWPGFEIINQAECPKYAFMDEITEGDCDE